MGTQKAKFLELDRASLQVEAMDRALALVVRAGSARALASRYAAPGPEPERGWDELARALAETAPGILESAEDLLVFLVAANLAAPLAVSPLKDRALALLGLWDQGGLEREQAVEVAWAVAAALAEAAEGG